MAARVVTPLGVQDLLAELIGDEVDALEGYIHSQLSGIATVESVQALSSYYRPDTICHVLMRAFKHLHTLLDHCCGQDVEGVVFCWSTIQARHDDSEWNRR